jgi:EVE domain
MMTSWIAVASANHVAIGRAQGFMQVNHGKLGPLKRLIPGDWVAYYSPTAIYGGTAKLQAFTAIGRIREGAPYQGDMGGGFTPFRRDVDWLAGEPAAIAPLLQELDFTRGKTNWGYQLRFGLFKVVDGDMQIIARAMGVSDGG